MSSMVKSKVFYPGGCGICETNKEKVNGYYAPNLLHGSCFKAIEMPQEVLYEKVCELFKDKAWGQEQDEALIAAFTAVRKSCGEYTILTYLEEKGADALTELFRTVGVAALQGRVNV